MCAPPASARGPLETIRPKLRVADVLRDHADAYRRDHVLSRQQAKALGAIAVCRTAELGGHVDLCPKCDFARPAYNSCRNRHCPSCQATAQAAWVEERQERVLPTHHFHVVFTLPAQLRPIATRNQAAVFDAMFAAASETLLTLGQQRLGGDIGASVILHTWTRAMLFHPHVHCVVTGGALVDDRWNATKKAFLFPVAVMRKLFSTLVRAKLRMLWSKLDLGGSCAHLAKEKAFVRMLRSLRRKHWVVYVKPPFNGPSGLFRYLGQYTHRVAISDHRLLDVTDERVVFRTRGSHTVSLTPVEFIRRFLLHVLPHPFRKIRHFGLYAPSRVNTALERARTALIESGAAINERANPPADAENVAKDAASKRTCPICAAPLFRMSLQRLQRLLDDSNPSPMPHDTS